MFRREEESDDTSIYGLENFRGQVCFQRKDITNIFFKPWLRLTECGHILKAGAFRFSDLGPVRPVSQGLSDVIDQQEESSSSLTIESMQKAMVIDVLLGL
jgi:hypothetical protein